MQKIHIFCISKAKQRTVEF